MFGDALRLIFPADHESRNVLKKQKRDPALAGQFDEVSTLLRALAEQHAIVGEDRNRHAPDMRKPADQGGAVKRLELVELAAIDDARDHLMDVIWRTHILWNDRVKFFGVIFGRPRRLERKLMLMRGTKVADDVAHYGDGMLVIFGKMIGHSRPARVEFSATEVLRADFLARRGFHQRRAGQEDRSLLLHDDRLVRHCGDVGAARGAASHHTGNLRNAFGAHIGLVEEYPAKMVAVGKNLRLMGQVGSARIDQINARKVIGLSNFLGTQMLLHGHRIVSAAFDRGVVADDHHLPTRHAADPGDNSSRRDFAIIQVIGGKLPDLQKRGAGIKHSLHPLAW